MKIEQDIWNEFTQFQQVCKANPVFPECAFLHHLEELIPQLAITISIGDVFYRARVYHNSFPEMVLDYAKRIHDDIEHGDQILGQMKKDFDKLKVNKEFGFNGFDRVGSFVNPNPRSICSGRCNHNYEICLYVAEDVETAISELKPLIREEISVAPIKVKEELKVIDLSYNTSDSPYKRLTSFLFVTSPTQEDYDIYTYTQTICSLVKKMGYDGIKYTSCQNLSKVNYAIFNYGKCEAISSNVYTVNSIDYGFTEKI